MRLHGRGWRCCGSKLRVSTSLEAHGVLEYGSWVDPETGFVSQLRLREAGFNTV